MTSLDAGRSSDVIYVDMAKAFESVSHPKLLAKLSAYGITGKTLQWIECWISGRSQQIRVDGCLSDFSPVKSGVVQGSNLGPILFIIFFNDIVDNIPKEANPTLFADDLKIYHDGPLVTNNSMSHSPILQRALDVISDWTAQWQLKLSITKCNVLVITKYKTNLPRYYTVNDIVLPQVYSVCDLGVQVDSTLSFNEHVTKLASKAQQRSGLLRRCFMSRDPIILKRAFSVYVRPIVEYVSPVWCPHLMKYITTIERVQRIFTKFVPSVSSLSYNNRAATLKLDLLETRRLQTDLTTYYKILNNLLPSIHPDMLCLSPLTLTRGHPYKLSKLPFRTNMLKFSFMNRVINIWNTLPLLTVCAGSISAFKAMLKMFDLTPFLFENQN